MSSRPLLEARPEDRQDNDPVRLRREIAGLEQELQAAKDESATAKAASHDAVQAIRALRNHLEGFYKSLKMIFGEISRVDASGVDMVQKQGSLGLSPKLEMLKTRLGGRQAEFIDLLQHGEMTTAQLCAAAHCRRTAVGNTIYQLTKAGLIKKNGNKFSLKEL